MTPSFPHRMLAVLARAALTLFEHLPPLVAAFVFVAGTAVAVTVMVAVPWRLALLVARVRRYIAQHIADHALNRLNREYAELCNSLRADDGADAEYLPGVTHLGRPTPPPPGRQVRRRMAGVRIPGRRVRRTTSSSDRRFR